MAVEFICFIGGSLIILIPGVWLAGALSLGKDRVERWAYGCCVGLALAVYLASLISRFDLRLFYPIWGVVAVGCLVFRIVSAKRRATQTTRLNGNAWIYTVLLLVAITRFGTALPQPLPEGPYDPTVHLILAGKIQETQHSISDWEPFESVALNYPTGSHTLVVVLSALTQLPLHTVFKDLIPLLGVLSTALIFVFARRVAGDESIALWTAAIYGLWAWYGSIDYFRWSGVPNEMGMLFFLTMLTLWMDDIRGGLRTMLMALVYAGVILVHHHAMLVSGLIILTLLISVSPRRILVYSVLLALALDSFFLVPYAMRIASLHSTTVLYDSEPRLLFRTICVGIGLVNLPFALAGIVIWFTQKSPRFHPVVFCAIGVLAGAFVLTEYVIPLLTWLLKHTSDIAFAPSRFLTDLNYFLPLFAATCAAFIQSRLRIRARWAMVFVCLLALVDWRQWKELIKPTDSFAPPGFIDACRWIHDHTSLSTVVLNRDNWTTYLAWRRATFTPLPGSDPIPDHRATLNHLSAIMSGQILPDAPDMTIVKILPDDVASDQAVLWKGSGYKVVQVWPTEK